MELDHADRKKLIRAVIEWLAERRRIIIHTDEYEDVAKEVLDFDEPTMAFYDSVYEALEPMLQDIEDEYCGDTCPYVVWPRELGEIPYDVMRTIKVIYNAYYDHHEYDEYDNTVDDIAASLIYRHLLHPFDRSKPLAWMLFKLAEHYGVIEEVEVGGAKYYRIGNALISHTMVHKNPPGFWYHVYEFADSEE